MSDVEHFAVLVLVVGAAIIAAVLLNRVSERIRIPAPAIFLVAAALASDVMPALGELSVTTVQRIVSVALAVILFDGGMHMGWQRFRSAAGPVLWVGVAGTFVTAAALATLAHVLFGLEWRAALLVGTALAPTDPAVVFSVLGRREVAGRSGDHPGRRVRRQRPGRDRPDGQPAGRRPERRRGRGRQHRRHVSTPTGRRRRRR